MTTMSGPVLHERVCAIAIGVRAVVREVKTNEVRDLLVSVKQKHHGSITMINRKFTSRKLSNRKLNNRKLNDHSAHQAEKQRVARRSLFLENLERRDLLTSIGLTDDGIVEVQATERADTISVFVAEERFVVKVNGTSTSFNNDDVDGLYVEAKGGDDSVRIDGTVVQPTLVFGGLGNDRIAGGAGVDAILGGSGDDTVYGNLANDIILGDGPNSLDEVPLPQPTEPTLDIALAVPVVVDLRPVDPQDPEPDPLALHRYLSRISGINAGSDTIVGGIGHDMIFAGREGDKVTGDGANVPPDTVPPVVIGDAAASDGTVATFDVAPDIIPLPANDYIEAGAGHDVVNSGPGNDLVFGGAGNDHLRTGAGADIVVGGSGHDRISSGIQRDHVLGDGPNTINQVILNADDIYLANSALGRGNDTIQAGDGNDQVYTGDTHAAAVNLVFGGAGDDFIIGGAGGDAIGGGAGDDTIRSGAGDDIVLGDGANSLPELPLPRPNEPVAADLSTRAVVTDIAPLDPTAPDPFALHKYLSRVSGIHAGNDSIVAGSGNDLVFAGAGNDRVEGDGANVYPLPALTAAAIVEADVTLSIAPLPAPSNHDYIEAGSGNDRVDSGAGHDIVFGGTGSDTLYSGTGNDIVVGGSGNDVIRTQSGADVVLGDGPATINQVIFTTNDIYWANSEIGGGNDYIESGGGDDTVLAGRGRDVVFAGAGDDYAHGGPDGDLLVGDTGADTLIGGGGDDVIITGGPNQGPRVATVDTLVATLVNDGTAAGDQSNDYVDAGAGHDRVFAFGGSDLVFGGTGNDLLRAGAGRDVLVGGDGHDVISAGAGNDIVLGDGPNSLNEAVVPMPTDAAAWDLPWLWSVLLANSVLGIGNDVIDGGAGDDLMFGGAGHDLLFGRMGNDLLHGGHGDDELHDDLNSGGGGTDLFIGDCGADKIFANDGTGGPVDFVFYDDDDELHVDGEDQLFELPTC